MMREIKFRGKTINKPIEWRYGSTMVSLDMGQAIIFEEVIVPIEGEEDTGCVELSFHPVWVDINTVGQFTGLQDKNGVDIYENDAVKYYQPYAKRWDTHIVKWDDEFACFGMFEDGNEWCKENDWMKIEEIEVVGNIHDIK